MIDEGYTKYEVDWTPSEPLGTDAISELDRWRRELHRAGLIGYDESHGVGYGNISTRYGEHFIISGTQTGHIEDTGPEHYALVTASDIAGNRVSCSGPVQASSESLTHAAIYAAAPDVKAIVHVHDGELWRASLGRIPTSGRDVPYGTPEMADEFGRLLEETGFAEIGVAAMGGHEGGLIATGDSVREAATRMLAYRQRIAAD